jgi:hypothetical protein
LEFEHFAICGGVEVDIVLLALVLDDDWRLLDIVAMQEQNYSLGIVAIFSTDTGM